MKKLFAILLAGALLCGCTAEPPEPTVPDTTEATTPATEEIVIDYDSLELLEFDYEDVYAAAPMGDDLLLFSGDTETTLIKLSGRNLKELATVATGVRIEPGHAAVQVSESGVCYPAEKEYIFLNENLEEAERVALPGAWGTGAVTADQQNIWYSTGSDLRVYDRRTGLDRLLRETTHMGLALESLELNDSVLVCTLSDASAVMPTLFYSAATGELLGTCRISISLESAGDLWAARTSDGRENQTILGGSGEARILTTTAEGFTNVTPVDGGVLIKCQTGDTIAIRFLDLENNTEAAVALENDADISNAWRDGNILWIALTDGRVCRWDLKDAEPQEPVFGFGPYYNRENPDVDGLAALDSVTADLETTYGVRIHIYEDAVTAMPENAALISEYRVDALEDGLERLSAALSRFTPEFLAAAAKSSDDGKIHICLVRSVSGEGCFQFWDEAGNARMALAVGDTLEQDFYHGLAHLIDARVMTRTTSFDSWKNLNPKGFDYTYDFGAAPEGYADAFVDAVAMVSPVEDRARVFEYAMLADSGEAFQSDTMQKKLSTLCAGIRKAFKLKDADPLPWEQYMNG